MPAPNTLKFHTVMFTNSTESATEYFQCQAEDEPHAREQCLNAEPAATILRVSEGDTRGYAL